MSLQKILGATLFLFAASTLISQSAMDLFASLFFLLFIVWAWPRRSELKADIKKIPGKTWAALWFFSFVLSAAFSQEPKAWLKLFDFRWLILAVAIGLFLKQVGLTRKVLWQYAGVFTVSSAYAVLVFIFQRDLIFPDHVLDRVALGARSGGFLLQPIVFAHLYALWICLFAGLVLAWLDERSRKHSDIWFFVAAATGLGGILVSFTRGAWIALFVALVVMAFARRLRMGLLVFASGASIFGLFFTFWPALQARVTETLTSDTERKWIWKANWSMFLDHPWLGVGYTNNVNLLPEYYAQMSAPPELMISHAHNQFLHILAGTGAIGFLFYLSFWFFALRLSWKTIGVHSEGGVIKAGLSLGLLASLICFLLGGLTESNFEHSKIRYVLSICLGVLLWLSFQRFTPPRERGD